MIKPMRANRIIRCSGSRYQIGLTYGKMAREAIRYNVAPFRKVIARENLREKMLSLARLDSFLPEHIEELQGLADGCGISFEDLVLYNLYKHVPSPDECTVMIALPPATANGNVLFLKNSDKVGGGELVGPNFYEYKEVNVLLDLTLDGGNRIVAVAAAGSLGAKMGLNDKGVAVGTNIARTEELRERKAKLTTIRAIDRAQLAREALERSSAVDAAEWVISRVVRNPMGTPGNMQFVDKDQAIIIECSYDRYAIEVVKEGVAARSNSFVLLKELNQWDDVSSHARYVRAQQLMRENFGKITADSMRSFSVDHENGPGPNSICRHGSHYSEETSLSAAVIEIDRDEPSRSEISVALGKPCHAWRHPEANVTLAMNRRGQAPSGFASGAVWKRFYTEEPLSEPKASAG